MQVSTKATGTFQTVILPVAEDEKWPKGVSTAKVLVKSENSNGTPAELTVKPCLWQLLLSRMPSGE